MSGFGRRVSSLLFAVQPQVESKLLSIVPMAGASQKHSNHCLVVSSRSLQCWKMGEQCSMQCETDLSRVISEAFLEEVWLLTTKDAQSRYRSSVKTWLLDAVSYRGGALLLLACANTAVSEEIHFALAWILRPDLAISEFDWFGLVNMDFSFEISREDSLFGVRLLSPDRGRSEVTGAGVGISVGDGAAFVHIPGEFPDRLRENDVFQLRFGRSNMLGIGCDEKTCLVFLHDLGLQALKLLPEGLDSSVLDSSYIKALTESQKKKTPSVSRIREADETASVDVRTEQKTKFRSAFFQFARQQLAECHDTLSELIGNESVDAPKPNLEHLVTELCLDIVDDYPASDPRWAKSLNSTEGSISGRSLILLYQLEDKRKTIELLATFLRSTFGLWQRLGPTTLKDGRRLPSVRCLMVEAVEKLEAAMALYKMGPESHSHLLEQSMSAIIKQRGESKKRDLSLSDMFYRKVSDLDKIFPALYRQETSLLTSTADAEDRVNLIRRELSVSGVYDCNC